MWWASGDICCRQISGIRHWCWPLYGSTGCERMSECILPSSSNCTRLHNNRCVQMPSACICNFTHWLRQCDAIRHTKPSHAPSGNGAAVGGTNHPPDPTRWSTINVRGTEAIALVSREKAHRIQTVSPCTLCALRRHTGVPRLADASSYATPLPTLCRRFTTSNSTTAEHLRALAWRCGTMGIAHSSKRHFYF